MHAGAKVRRSYNIIDYLAERVRLPLAVGAHLKSNRITDFVDACHASRTVDGGVDSQA
jgi:hypothetical protein